MIVKNYRNEQGADTMHRPTHGRRLSWNVGTVPNPQTVNDFVRL